MKLTNLAMGGTNANAKKQIWDCFIRALIMDNAHNTCFGDMKQDLANNFTRHKDEYLHTGVQASRYIINWQSSNPALPTTATGISFTTTDTSPSKKKRKGKGKRKAKENKEKIPLSCWICAEEHYAKDCPHKGKLAGILKKTSDVGAHDGVEVDGNSDGSESSSDWTDSSSVGYEYGNLFITSHK